MAMYGARSKNGALGGMIWEGVTPEPDRDLVLADPVSTLRGLKVDSMVLEPYGASRGGPFGP